MMRPAKRRQQRTLRAAATLLAAGVTATAMLAALASCTSGEPMPEAPAHDSRPLVLTTFTVIADIAKQVAGDGLRVESLVRPGAEIHGYEPTPGDLRRAADAELILDNGLGLEAWFEQFVSELDVPHVVVSEGVTPINIAGDAYDGLPNPHAWMSALNAQIYADNMAEAFAELDPAGEASYRENAAAYSAELQQLHDELVSDLGTLPAAHRALVSCEGAFSYLARDLGLSEYYIWPVNAERQATPRQIAAVIDFVRENKVPAVFCESTMSPAPMLRVVESSDAEFGGTLYVDSLSAADGPVPTYLELLRHNANVIAAGLSGRTEGAS